MEAGLMPSVLDMTRGSLSFMLMIHFGASLAVPLGLCSILQENAISCTDRGSAQTLAEPEDKRDKIQKQSFKKPWEECTQMKHELKLRERCARRPDGPVTPISEETGVTYTDARSGRKH